MGIYRAKTLINGYRLGDTTGSTFVSLPKTYTTQDTTISYNNKSMVVIANTPPSYQKTFIDQFERQQTYTLYYYLWTPIVKTKREIKKEARKQMGMPFDKTPEINMDVRARLAKEFREKYLKNT